MDETSPPVPASRHRRSRRRTVGEVVREAQAALKETIGETSPISSPIGEEVRRYLFSLRTSPSLLRKPPRIPLGRFLFRHAATLLVLALLLTTLAGRGFAAYVSPQQKTQAEGGIRFLLRGDLESNVEEPFAFSIAPLAVAPRATAPAAPDLDQPPPETDEAPLSHDVVIYTVQPGDTLDSIAAQFEVAPYTIFWVNRLRTPGDLTPGMALTIPPISGVPHIVRPGETLESVADRYGVRPGNIVGYPPNALTFPYELEAGQEIFVPGGVIYIPSYPVEPGDEWPAPTLVQMPGGEKLRWPTWGYISAPFGWSRAYGGYHRGMDIANNWGTPVYAAAAGKVVEAGWSSLGYYAKIDHGNGFRTIYGHLARRPLVSAGEQVERGQLIGYMGSTYGAGGYASGVHLHFAVQHHGVYIDPRPLLEE